MSAYLHLFEKHYDTPKIATELITLLENRDEKIKYKNYKICRMERKDKKKDEKIKKHEITIQELLKSLDKFSSIEERFNELKEIHMKKKAEKAEKAEKAKAEKAKAEKAKAEKAKAEKFSQGEAKEENRVEYVKKTENEEHFTTRMLPLDSYNGISPNNLCDAHIGHSGSRLYVKVYTSGRVEKINSKNWTTAAHESFKKRYWT